MFNPACVVLIVFLVPSLEGKPQGYRYQNQPVYQQNNGYPSYPVYPPPFHPHPIYPHPIQPNPVYPQPGYPHPIYPNPIQPNPVHPHPIYPQPTYPNPGYPNPIYPTSGNRQPSNLTPSKDAHVPEKNPVNSTKPEGKNKPLSNSFHLEESSSFSFTSAKAGSIVHHYKSEDSYNAVESHSSVSVKSKGGPQKDNETVVVAIPPKIPVSRPLPHLPPVTETIVPLTEIPNTVIPEEPEASTEPSEANEYNIKHDPDIDIRNDSENSLESSNKSDIDLEPNNLGTDESPEEGNHDSENISGPNELTEEVQLNGSLKSYPWGGEPSNEDKSTNSENASDD